MKPLPKGKPLARCVECNGEAVAHGDGRPVTIIHAPDCSESPTEARSPGGLVCNARRHGYTCTLTVGHEGAHVGAGYAVATWSGEYGIEIKLVIDEDCRTSGEPVKMMSQRMSGYCSPRCEVAPSPAYGSVQDSTLTITGRLADGDYRSHELDVTPVWQTGDTTSQTATRVAD